MKKKKLPQTSILIFLIAFASISAVIYTPALPAIQEVFSLSPAYAGISMTVFMLGYALGQLPYGPLSNRFGRKNALYMGISLAFISALICFASAYFRLFFLLLIGRFFLALGSGAGVKMCFTMIGDSYKRSDAVKVISICMMAFAISPPTAIAIGGILTTYFSWDTCFIFTALYAVFLFILVLFLPETIPEKDPYALVLKKIITKYSREFANAKLVMTAGIVGCGTGSLYIFATKAPFIGINVLGLSPEKYGFYNLIPVIGGIIGSAITIRYSEHENPLFMILIGIIGVFCAYAAMLATFLAGYLIPLTLFVPFACVMFANSIQYAFSTAFAMSEATDKATGSSILTFMNIGIAFLLLSLANVFPSNVPIYTPIILTAVGIMMFGIHRCLQHKL